MACHRRLAGLRRIGYCSLFGRNAVHFETAGQRDPFPRPFLMHYPHKVSKIKRIRKVGFRARMKTRAGRRMINSKRRTGRRVSLD